jgi:hypothetical protein
MVVARPLLGNTQGQGARGGDEGLHHLRHQGVKEGMLGHPLEVDKDV